MVPQLYDTSLGTIYGCHTYSSYAWHLSMDPMDIQSKSSPVGYPVDKASVQVHWIISGYPVGYPGPVYPVPSLMAVIVFLIQTVTVFLAVLFANKIPRRPLLLTTTAIMTVSIFIVGCLGIPGGDVSPTYGKVIISFVIVEITAFNFGWGPLGWTIVSFALTIR